jgi:hypothetical protein
MGEIDVDLFELFRVLYGVVANVGARLRPQAVRWNGVLGDTRSSSKSCQSGYAATLVTLSA